MPTRHPWCVHIFSYDRPDLIVPFYACRSPLAAVWAQPHWWTSWWRSLSPSTSPAVGIAGRSAFMHLSLDGALADGYTRRSSNSKVNLIMLYAVNSGAITAYVHFFFFAACERLTAEYVPDSSASILSVILVNFTRSGRHCEPPRSDADSSTPRKRTVWCSSGSSRFRASVSRASSVLARRQSADEAPCACLQSTRTRS